MYLTLGLLRPNGLRADLVYLGSGWVIHITCHFWNLINSRGVFDSIAYALVRCGVFASGHALGSDTVATLVVLTIV